MFLGYLTSPLSFSLSPIAIGPSNGSRIVNLGFFSRQSGVETPSVGWRPHLGRLFSVEVGWRPRLGRLFFSRMGWRPRKWASPNSFGTSFPFSPSLLARSLHRFFHFLALNPPFILLLGNLHNTTRNTSKTPHTWGQIINLSRNEGIPSGYKIHLSIYGSF